jgi:hypothetical protein
MRLCRISTASMKAAELRNKHPEAMEAFKTDPEDAVRRFPEVLELIFKQYQPMDEIAFDLVLRNDGELTIRDPAVELQELRAPRLFDGWTVQVRELPSRSELRGAIYPGDQREIERSRCELRCLRSTMVAPGDYVVKWRVFLNNSPPSVSEIDLGTHIQGSRKA